ncbi:MAG: hypothetical protein HEQ14_19945 [Aphanizomenon flos-aquae CP01]|jgi:hypothetical protein|nr:hypothetical protein [Aphanizomenon flos-aquae CP01]
MKIVRPKIIRLITKLALVLLFAPMMWQPLSSLADEPPPLDVVAIGIYQGGDVTSTNGSPLLAGRYSSGLESHLSLSNINDILNDIIKGGNEVDRVTNSEIIKIGGVVYSSTDVAMITVTPGNIGGTANLPANSISVLFSGPGGSVDIAFNGSFFGTGSPIDFIGSAGGITSGQVNMNPDHKGTFLLYGDVIESSVSCADDVGSYSGSLTISAMTN